MTQLEYLQYNLNFVTISMHFNYFMETSTCYLFNSVLIGIILLFINQRINFHLKNTLTIHIQFLHMFMLYNLCVFGVCLVILDCLWPCGVQPTSLLCPWDFPGKNTGVGSISSSLDLPDSGTEPASPEFAGRFFTTEPQASWYNSH